MDMGADSLYTLQFELEHTHSKEKQKKKSNRLNG